jgi:hypothetical protein
MRRTIFLIGGKTDEATKPASEFLQKLGYIHETEIAGKGRSVRSLRRVAQRGAGPRL